MPEQSLERVLREMRERLAESRSAYERRVAEITQRLAGRSTAPPPS